MGNARYFSHDSNARNDQKVLMLRAECGWAGYGIYFALLEIMFDNDDTCIKRKALKPLAMANNIDIKDLTRVVDVGIAEGLFMADDDCVWSNGLRVRKEMYEKIRQQRSDAGKRGMDTRWEAWRKQKELEAARNEPHNTVANAVITPLPQTDNSVITIKEKEKKENKEKEYKERESQMAVEVIAYLNQVAKTGFKSNADAAVRHINAREKEGYAYEDFVTVIDYKCKEWQGTEFEKFIRPETLFGTKFDGYLNAARKGKKNGKQEEFLN